MDEFKTWALCFSRPGLALDWLKFGAIPYEEPKSLPIPTLNMSMALSWVLTQWQGLCQLLFANILLWSFWTYFHEAHLLFGLIDLTAGLFPYYLLIVGTALELILFPLMTLLLAEFWILIIRIYAFFLKSDDRPQKVAEDITTVAMSSHLLLIIPILGSVLQKLAWTVLLYIGLRRRLGATRSLSFVILLTPLVLIFAGLALVILFLQTLFVIFT